jgi:hypothetical protein
MKESEPLRHIEQIFDAVPETAHPSHDDLRLLDRRSQLDRELPNDPELFAVRYEEARRYGLDEKLLKKIK